MSTTVFERLAVLRAELEAISREIETLQETIEIPATDKDERSPEEDLCLQLAGGIEAIAEYVIPELLPLPEHRDQPLP